ncbi:MAG: cysteine--tRNA ligase, partial [Candidatus Micrarchaeota archaeon]
MMLYDSLSRQTEAFKPVEDKLVRMYVCGITPYDDTHIGHARSYVAFDMIKRFLINDGYSVYHIQNITDVDDKIIKRCKETGADPRVLPRRLHEEALELFGRLGILPADVYPAVTEHIPQIIRFIQALMGKGAAYETPDGVYFSVKSFPGYGKLSGQDLERIRAGARIEVDENKKDPADFALWKKTGGEIIEFESPWGRGRPGWHIECSVMANEYSKNTLDIHGGGRDLIFPHHENEVAQSEAATGRKFCNNWLHTGFLTVDGEKMSKSLGNFITLKQALSQFEPNALRLFFLQMHYRSPLDYNEDSIRAAGESVERIFNSLGLIRETIASTEDGGPDAEFRAKSDELIEKFRKDMENDFNTPEAIASLFNLLRLSNSHLSGKPDKEQLTKVAKSIESMIWVLGLVERRSDLDGKTDALLSLVRKLGGGAASPEEALEKLVAMRDDARAKKDYKKSDLIRERLKGIGIILEDKSG